MTCGSRPKKNSSSWTTSRRAKMSESRRSIRSGMMAINDRWKSISGSSEWIEPTLLHIKKCLDSEEIPERAEKCDYCTYREYAGKKLLAQTQKLKGTKSLGL